MGRVIAAAAYNAGRKVADIAIEDSGQWAARPGHFVWIGIDSPSEPSLRQLQAQFGLHELAIEDALNAHQRPKLEKLWRDYLPGAAHRLPGRWPHRPGRDRDLRRPRLHHLGPPWRLGVLCPGAPVRRGAPKRLANGEDYVLYALVDFIVDNYLVVVERLREEVEALEEMSWAAAREAKIARIYELRRELQRLKLVAAPTAEVCRRLEHADLPGIDPSFGPISGTWSIT